MVLDPKFLEAMRRHEGYYPKAYWDHKQYSIGYGTRASGPNETIDRAEAERRFAEEVGGAAKIVDSFAPGLDPGTRAALTSLTYNAGGDWMKSGLGRAIKAGDLDDARARFVQYVNASGKPLPGLQKRRAEEVQWFGQDGTTPPSSAENDEGGLFRDGLVAALKGWVGGSSPGPDAEAEVAGAASATPPKSENAYAKAGKEIAMALRGMGPKALDYTPLKAEAAPNNQVVVGSPATVTFRR